MMLPTLGQQVVEQLLGEMIGSPPPGRIWVVLYSVERSVAYCTTMTWQWLKLREPRDHQRIRLAMGSDGSKLLFVPSVGRWEVLLKPGGN